MRLIEQIHLQALHSSQDVIVNGVILYFYHCNGCEKIHIFHFLKFLQLHHYDSEFFDFILSLTFINLNFAHLLLHLNI